ncbi:MAG: hypothetical protein OXQ94_04035 [Gemmatimonadota bacterium]|nr:hypothetical protein [Gemmatimonadota bacterium]
MPALPVTMDVQVVDEDAIYAIETDGAGVEHVVRFDVSGAGEHRAVRGFLAGCRQSRRFP